VTSDDQDLRDGYTRGPNLLDVAQMRGADNSGSWRAENLPACTS